MTSVNPGSLPQNWRASSRAAAVQRLCPSITWTVSPGRTLRATASPSDVTTGPPGDGAAGVTKPASPQHRTSKHLVRRHFLPQPNLTTVSG